MYKQSPQDQAFGKINFLAPGKEGRGHVLFMRWVGTELSEEADKFAV